MVEDVEFAEHQITEGNEALFWSGEMDEEHRGKVTHTLYITNIWSVVLKSSKHFDETLAQAMNLFEQFVKMRKGSWDIFEQQRVALFQPFATLSPCTVLLLI